jgi:hypothetical protein
LAAIIVIFFHLPAKWIYDPDTSVCLHQKFFGISCPLCGMTRAIYELLHLNIKYAIIQNFAVIPFVLMLVIAVFFILFPSKMKKTFFIMLYITLAVFVVVYILRLAGLY